MVAGREREPVLVGDGADERVVDRPARDACSAECGQERGRRLGAEKSGFGNDLASNCATVPGVRRAGGGRRVSTENVSNAAWPASPQRRSRSAWKAFSWWS